MSSLPNDINLLELRKSERERLAKALEAGAAEDIENFVRNIDNSLSRFIAVFPENEEQVYLFGLDMHHLLKAAALERSVLGSLRDHLNVDVKFVFVCGLLGLTFEETRSRLEVDRRRRRKEVAAELDSRRARFHKSEVNLVRDIEELVSEKAGSLLTPDIDK
jgi:hypothetical protein